MPDTLTDTAPRPGDERLMPVMTRRATVDWVLGRVAAAEPRVEVRYGVKVTGLLAASGPAAVPHVTGVRTDQGDLAADLVVDATGRRSPVDDWLAQLGASPIATSFAECGIAYYSRHYRIRPAAALPGLPVTRTVIALDEFLAGKWERTTVRCSWWWRRWPPTAGSGPCATPGSSPPCCGPSRSTPPGWT
jgi:hypothetical protein